jgi:pimeloyl-ACP methyl ester carboxylesterase
MRNLLKIKLADGRILAYRDYGNPSGVPIFLLHGLPGSSLWFLEDDSIAHELNIRHIATDRPGFGASEFNPNMTILNYSDDIIQLADSLNLETFHMIGVSGGGAFAMAGAYQHPRRVQSIGLISSVSPITGDNRDMAFSNRMAFFLAKHAPFVLRGLYSMTRRLIMKSPQRYIQAIQNQLSEADKISFNDLEIQQVLILQLQEAYAQGVQGALHETRLQAHDWGFDISRIQVNTHIWHGDADTLAPFDTGVYLHHSIPNSQFYPMKGAGHLFSDNEVIWRDILTQMTT